MWVIERLTGRIPLGQALAVRLGAGFINGDDHAGPDKPWYGSILSTSRGIAAAAVAALAERPPRVAKVVIAYPLTCMQWIYFRRRFGDAGIRTLFVSLAATFEAIVHPARGRVFSAAEQARIRAMIAQGYGARPFSDLVFDTGVDTGQAEFATTLARLEQRVREMTDVSAGRMTRR